MYYQKVIWLQIDIIIAFYNKKFINKFPDYLYLVFFTLDVLSKFLDSHTTNYLDNF